MSVNYSIVCKDGQKATVSSVCFGKMNVNRWFEQSAMAGTSQDVISRGGEEHAFIALNCSVNIHPCWFQDMSEENTLREFPEGQGVEGRKIACRNFLGAMKDLLADLPMLKGILTVHPLLGVVRVYIKEHQADEIMEALYLVRNLNQYSSYGSAYRKAIRNGYRPRFAAILAHMLPGEHQPGSFGRVPEFKVTNATIGEYNWFNPNTFGKQSFLNLMKQDLESFSWKLHKWKDSPGYRRDGYFVNEGVIFDDRYNSSMGLKYWHMVDCLCVPGDEPILEEDHDWNSSRGFKFKSDGMSSDSDYLSDSFYEQVLTGLEALCNEHSISIRA